MNEPRELVVDNVTKTWKTKIGANTPLRDLSLQIPFGQFVCLLGPSGCGKSTLLDLVAGLEAPSSGKIVLDGANVVGTDPSRGLVFQDRALFPWQTVLENVEFGLHMAGMNKRARREVARDMIKLVGLGHFEKAFPRELSGGMYQRVAVARVLVNRPEILLMDEPFGALDAQTREELQAETLRIWQSMMNTVLFVTHSVQESVLLADRIVVLSSREGAIQDDLVNSLDRPRDVTSAEFGEMMRRTYDSLKKSR